MGERLRRLVAIGAIVSSVVVVALVIYAAATRRDPNPPLTRDPSATSATEPLFPETARAPESPAPSSLTPGLRAGTGLVPSMPGAERARVSGQAQGGAARSSVFGIAPASPQALAEDLGGPVAEAGEK